LFPAGRYIEIKKLLLAEMRQKIKNDAKGASLKNASGHGTAAFIAPFAICAVGAVFIVIGVSRGEAATVLMKAIRICLECIGIG
jgi:hypothetical protein